MLIPFWMILPRKNKMTMPWVVRDKIFMALSLNTTLLICCFEIKTERRQISREQREAEKQRCFELKQQKRKEKKRGH